MLLRRGLTRRSGKRSASLSFLTSAGSSIVRLGPSTDGARSSHSGALSLLAVAA